MAADLSRRSLMTFAGGLTALALASPLSAQEAQYAAGAAWDLTELYPSAEAWTAERNAVLAALPGLSARKGTLTRDAATLAATLQMSADLDRRAARLIVYATLKNDEDVRIPVNQERRTLATALGTAFGEATAWIAPELIAAGPARIQALAADPALTKFRFDLGNVIRQAPHTLSLEGEGLLASAGGVISGPGDIRAQLATSDIPWPEVTLSTGDKIRLDQQGYAKGRVAKNRADRKLVFDTYYAANRTYQNSFGAIYAAKVKGDVFNAKARKYDNTLQWALSGPNIPEGVYRTLVAEANNGLPQLHRYFDVRRRLLGLPDMAYYDIYPPLVTTERKFSLEEMRSLTLEGLKPLGPEYGGLLAKGTAARWMDPRPRPGKYAGAYMYGSAYDVHPYLLLNLYDTYEDVSTYAHEWGHAVHTMLSRANQPYETFSYPTFTAEVASTCNEQLLLAHMQKTAKTRAEKLYYLGQQAESYRATFFRQTMFAEFELLAHEVEEKGEAVSGERLTAIYLDLLKRYHGPNVIIDPAYAVEWAIVPHFLNYNFYVFQYATSIAGSVAFAERIRGGKPAERERFLSMLKAGGSNYGYELLKAAGVDLATPEPYRATVAALKSTLDQMEALMA